MTGRKLLLVLVLAGTINANAAYDPEDVVKAYVGASIKYDSNLYRRTDSANQNSGQNLPEASDIIIEPRAGLKIDKVVSLQTIGLDLNIYAPRYVNSEHIDYTGWRNAAYWNWVVGRRFSGAIRYQDSKQLSAFDDVVAVPDNCPLLNVSPAAGNYIVDINRDKRFDFNANWVIGHNLQLSGALSRYSNVHSQSSCLDQDQAGYTLSVVYISDRGNQISVYARNTEADFTENLQYVSPPVSIPGSATTETIPAAKRGYEQSERGVSLKWLYSPKTELNASLGLSGVEFANGARGPDTSVGSVSLLWRYSPKTTFQTRYERLFESGTDRAGRNMVENYNLRIDWAPTVKTSTYMSGRYLLRDYDAGSAQSNIFVGREDKDVILEFGLNYRPVPALVLTSYVNFLKRNANVANADYTATLVGFTSQWWF